MKTVREAMMELAEADQAMAAAAAECVDEDYLPPTTAARETALLTAKEIVLMGRAMGVEIPAPRFECGADGSVGLHWRAAQVDLLFSVPSSGGELAHCYGARFGADEQPEPGTVLKGRFSTTSSNGYDVIEWMERYLLGALR